MDLSTHALKRISQRGISPEVIKIVLKHGTKIHRAGVLFVFMRAKDIPEGIQPSVAERLDGLIVVASSDGSKIITVYRNRKGLKEIKKKLKRFAVGESRPPRRVNLF